MRNIVNLLSLVALAFCLGVSPAYAEDFKLPDPQEISTFPPEALQLYSSGIRSLDRVDYINAYSYMSKAAQLAPDAVRLNMIAAALALKQGRTKPAAEARSYYETAIASYKNVLRQRGLDDDFRRNVENRMKVALDEQQNLAQRDVRREALGTEFVRALNREFAPSTPTPSAKAPGQVPVGPAQTPVVAGVGVPAYPTAVNVPQYPQQPGFPQPPGGFPQQPGLPGLPGADPGLSPAQPAVIPGMEGDPALQPQGQPGEPGQNIPI